MPLSCLVGGRSLGGARFAAAAAVLSVLGGCSQPAPDSEPACVYSVASSSEGSAFSIVLPAGWKHHETEAGGEAHVFLAPQGTHPYVWIRPRAAVKGSLEERRRLALLSDRHELLAEAPLGTSYFDDTRDVVWKRTETTGGVSIVSVDLITDHSATLRLFCKTSEHRTYAPVFATIVEQVRVYGDSPPSPLPTTLADLDLDPYLFAPRVAGPFRYILLGIVSAGLIGLVVVDVRLRRRRHREIVEAVDQAVEERKRSVARQSDRAAGADDYMRNVLRQRSDS